MSKVKDNTRDRIIEVATHLFLTKGYEATRISEIISALNGLTKGAVYHHFDSKEDIFNAVVEKIGLQNKEIFDEIKNDENLNGLEKLKKIIRKSFNNEAMDTITLVAPDLLESPKLLASFIKQIINVTIAEYIYPIIDEAVKDKSIKTDYPEELAEFISLSFNMWMNPLIFKTDEKSIYRKVLLFNDMLSAKGINIFDEKFIMNLKEKIK